MLELAYLTTVLQQLRERSRSIEEMLRETRQSNGNDIESPRAFRTRNYEQNEPLREVGQLRPPRLGLVRNSSGTQSRTDITQRNSRSTDPLDFNEFMDDVYRMFPFN